ncbi:LysR family transcriptional regulator [Nonomuraea sp. NPDC050451]|uniref:LysR family transcriptional regulator n=1 Tax=Nonomuraea sp. NPDC050451 TaxID=3364364 RepID=UPI0037A1DF8D
MELRDIELFLTPAEELHFGQTAERLHVTPSRVTQAIKKQERRIGGALFERSSRSSLLRPTRRRVRAHPRCPTGTMGTDLAHSHPARPHPGLRANRSRPRSSRPPRARRRCPRHSWMICRIARPGPVRHVDDRRVGLPGACPVNGFVALPIVTYRAVTSR